jgi:hypothetical protein
VSGGGGGGGGGGATDTAAGVITAGFFGAAFFFGATFFLAATFFLGATFFFGAAFFATFFFATARNKGAVNPNNVSIILLIMSSICKQSRVPCTVDQGCTTSAKNENMRML